MGLEVGEGGQGLGFGVVRLSAEIEKGTYLESRVHEAISPRYVDEASVVFSILFRTCMRSEDNSLKKKPIAVHHASQSRSTPPGQLESSLHVSCSSSSPSDSP